MNKDVVFLVVDSLMADCVFSKKYGESLTPNLDKIKKNCFFNKNIFSQGPYTEAGTRGLLTGENTLENEGYFLRYHKANTFITSIFKDYGYETYSLIYPTTLYSDWIFTKIDHVIYTSELIYDVFWSQKFAHYVEYMKNGSFDKRDMQDCIELFSLIFSAWLHFLDPKGKSSRLLLGDIDYDYDYESYYSIVKAEQKLFKNAPQEYVIEYLNSAPNHPLNRIKTNLINKIVNLETVKKAFSLCPKFEKEYKRKQFFLNIKNNFISAKELFDFFSLDKNIEKAGDLVNYIKLLARRNDFRVYKNDSGYKPLLSAHTQIRFISDTLCKQHDTPIFITAHVEEPHYFTTFFSYDSNNTELIREELEYASKYVSSISSQYRGLLTYDLAVRYIDRQIGQLIESLRNSGRLNNTVICITADHGSSYNSYPHRKTIVNNCHTENYRIPLIIYSQNNNGYESDIISSNINVIPTLLDFLGLPIPEVLQGRSLLQSEKKDNYAITEYMGPGCPDMRRNRVRLTIRNSSYLIAFEGFLRNPFSDGIITELYDLKEDKLELHNIAGKTNKEIDLLISYLKKRFEEIVENNKAWVMFK